MDVVGVAGWGAVLCHVRNMLLRLLVSGAVVHIEENEEEQNAYVVVFVWVLSAFNLPQAQSVCGAGAS